MRIHHYIFFLLNVHLNVFGQANFIEPKAYVLITHPKNPVTSVDRKFVEDAYLKKITLWGDNSSIKPVDLPSSSETRQVFSRKVLNRTVPAIKNYWQQRIFSGRDIPPPELDTDEAVINYVLRYPGSLGYVSGNARLGRVKVLDVK